MKFQSVIGGIMHGAWRTARPGHGGWEMSGGIGHCRLGDAGVNFARNTWLVH